MQRISREELRMLIGVALTIRRAPERRTLGISQEIHLRDVTDDLVQRIMGRPEGETIIILPDQVGPAHSPVPGRWNIDEPHPHPDLPFRSTIPAKRTTD